MTESRFEFPQLDPFKDPLQTTEEQQERIKEYQLYLKEQRDKFNQRIAEGKETYIIGGDSMKCLICGKSSFSPINIKYRHCRICDIFHNEEDDDSIIFKKSV